VHLAFEKRATQRGEFLKYDIMFDVHIRKEESPEKSESHVSWRPHKDPNVSSKGGVLTPGKSKENRIGGWGEDGKNSGAERGGVGQGQQKKQGIQLVEKRVSGKRG